MELNSKLTIVSDGMCVHSQNLGSPPHGSCFGMMAVKCTNASVVRSHVPPNPSTPLQGGFAPVVQLEITQRSQTAGRKVCSAHSANCWRLTLSAPAVSRVQSWELTSMP